MFINRYQLVNNKIRNSTIIIATALILISCRTLYYNIPDISDYKIFPYRIIKNSPDSIFYFAKSDDLSNLGERIYTYYTPLLPNPVTINDYAERSKSAVLIIIRNDTIIYEKYGKEYQESSIFNVFSVTKAFITTLVGFAIDDGLIKSVDQKITEFIPEFSGVNGFDEITVRHLLLHSSGIRVSNAKFNSFSDQARYYYSRNLKKLALKAKLNGRPGKETHYSSVDPQLLAMILERATGTTLSYYLQEKIWQSIGMQYEATWSLDNKGKNSIEKGFSCLNCTAIDLAKLGRLYLHNGIWENKQLLSSDFISEAIKRDSTDDNNFNFQYSFGLGPKLYGSYYSKGLYGQLIYIYPKKNILIIRVGEADLKYNPQLINHIMLQIIDQI